MTAGADKPFRFKQFSVEQSRSSMKVGTDAVLLGCWVDSEKALTILDVGTGTGVIALICAQRNQDALVEAVDIDHGSASDATENFRLSPWVDRMKVYETDYLEFQPSYIYDLIISNPPYFSDSIRAHDPVRSLARHDDSLPAEKFMSHAAGMLSKEGIVAVIIPTGQLAKWVDAAEDSRLMPHRICHVYTLANKEAQRVMVEFSFPRTGEPKMESILIEKSPGEFSEAYKNLTREFYTRW